MLDNIAYYQIFGFPVILYIGIIAFLFFILTTVTAQRMKHRRFSMKWHHRMVVITLIVALVHGMMGLLTEGVIGKTEISQKPANSEAMDYGAKIFRDHCFQCHPKGGNLINPAKPLKGSNILKDFDTFLSFIRDTKGMMPSFSPGQISDGEAMALYRYIISAHDFN